MASRAQMPIVRTAGSGVEGVRGNGRSRLRFSVDVDARRAFGGYG